MAELVDTYIEEELQKIVSKVLEIHGEDFNFYEIEEICLDFLNEIPAKIKDVTKIKRLIKYVNKEFELENKVGNENFHSLQNNSQYSLGKIPKYLFE